MFGKKNTATLNERREKDRQNIAIEAIVHRPEEDAVPVEIEIISGRGFLARTPMLLPMGKVLRISFPSGRAPHARVVWLEDGKVGCEFLRSVTVDDLLIAPAPRRRTNDKEFARKFRIRLPRTRWIGRAADESQLDLF